LFLIADGENDDRCPQPLPQLPENLLPILIGQAEIENDQIRRLLCGQFQSLLAGLGLCEPVAFSGKRSAQEPSNGQFILNDQK
jgi:hypothetical protein